MEKRENQRVMLTKRLLQESLTRLLQTEKIHKISIRALCEEAGVNRSTFYKYYGSQYDLLGEMEDELLFEVRTALEQEGAGAESDRARIGMICAYLEGHMDSVRVLVGNNVDSSFPEKLFGLPQVKEMILERLGDDYDEEQRHYVYSFFISGVYRVVQEWICEENPKSFLEIALLIGDLLDRICGSNSMDQK